MKSSFIDSTHCLFYTNHRPSILFPQIHTPPCFIPPSQSSTSSNPLPLIQQRLVQIPHIILLPIVHRIRHLPHLQDVIVRHRRQRPVPLRLTLPPLLHVRIPRQIVYLRRMPSMNEQQLRRSVLRLLRRLLLSDLLSTPPHRLPAPDPTRSHADPAPPSPARFPASETTPPRTPRPYVPPARGTGTASSAHPTVSPTCPSSP